MDCTKAKELINQHIDGRLDEGELFALREHIKACPACAEILSAYESLVGSVNGLFLSAPDVVTPALFRIRASRKPRGWQSRIVYVAAAAASVVVCIAAAKLIGIGGGTASREYDMVAYGTENSDSASDNILYPECENSFPAGEEATSQPSQSTSEKCSGTSQIGDAVLSTVCLDASSAEVFLQKLGELKGIAWEDFTVICENGYIVDVFEAPKMAEEALLAVGIERDLTDVTQLYIMLTE